MLELIQSKICVMHNQPANGFHSELSPHFVYSCQNVRLQLSRHTDGYLTIVFIACVRVNTRLDSRSFWPCAPLVASYVCSDFHQRAHECSSRFTPSLANGCTCAASRIHSAIFERRQRIVAIHDRKRSSFGESALTDTYTYLQVTAMRLLFLFDTEQKSRGGSVYTDACNHSTMNAHLTTQVL